MKKTLSLFFLHGRRKAVGRYSFVPFACTPQSRGKKEKNRDGMDDIAGRSLEWLPAEILASIIAWLNNRDFVSLLVTSKAFNVCPVGDVLMRRYGRLDLLDAVAVCPPEALAFLARRNGATTRYSTAHIVAAAAAGRVDNVLWLHKHTTAARHPVCSVPFYHYDTNPVVCLCGVVAAAAKGGHVDAIAPLVAAGYRVSTDAFVCAAKKGRVDVLAALHEAAPQQGTCPPTALAVAAKKGRADAVRFLLTQRPSDCMFALSDALRRMDNDRPTRALVVALAHCHMPPATVATEICIARAQNLPPEIDDALDAVLRFELSDASSAERRTALIRHMLAAISDRDACILFDDLDDPTTSDGSAPHKHDRVTPLLPEWARLLLDGVPGVVTEVCLRFVTRRVNLLLVCRIIGAARREAFRPGAAPHTRWSALSVVLVDNADLATICDAARGDTDILWSIAAQAMHRGRLDILDRLDLRRAAPAVWWIDSVDGAALDGHLDVIAHAHERGLFGFAATTMDLAAQEGTFASSCGFTRIAPRAVQLVLWTRPPAVAILISSSSCTRIVPKAARPTP
ncbi:Ankyrin repeat domain containing protein [Pandoravirus salinus]|uniref:Ankyrin repeat domain containing protein n=1 Tax=Pandoravirus salinus TaxID=1349410 RepID=S4W496_9VIRU|nr:ankyrin repeat domain [Pandoravirus salinus]AGO85155.2 Ankyrin repeat domain containing protein [Pandoravirus salinus]